MLDVKEQEYIRVFDLIKYSEILLGISEEEGKAKVTHWLSDKEVTLNIYSDFKGYALFENPQCTPYQTYYQCNYIHAWVKLNPFARNRVERYLQGDLKGRKEWALTKVTIDKLKTSQEIGIKYTPEVIEPIEPMKLKQGFKVKVDINKPLMNDNSIALSGGNTIEVYELYLKRDEVLKLINPSNICESREQQLERLINENRGLKIESKRSKLNCPQSSQLNDEPTHPKSIGSMTVLIATLLKLAEYDKDDLKQPHGAINKEIQAKAEGLGLSIKKDFIEKWLKKADDIL